ncbi:Hsp70 protein-domain-containing protein [Boletus reticuloceps]|uniref:Hsp70 protein-domain-containing protein n=1 Tax=Boletus reticuloceps TaxID=495285 RepID=A0A8I3A4C5_9AGAM|nr:Hsp70 protein-domain-containing protein [Boletus reticuloceps]
MPGLCLRRALCLFVLLTVFLESSFAALLAIDYGSDWIKASLIKPGLPFDVLLNKDSKRKIQASVAFKRDDRLFGTDAANLASRFPSDSFTSLKLLQGAPFSSEAVSYFAQISTSDIVESGRSTTALKQSDGTEWSTEELIAMQLSYVKQLAESHGEHVHDVVLTVPPHYTQFERDAIVDAVEIAGMKTLMLINDGTAVAVNYAMTRTFSSTPEYHIIYDAGASSTRATLVSFAAVEDPKTKAPYTQISVLGVGFDRSTSGTDLGRRMRDILVERFFSQHKQDIRRDNRGMAKLWQEASRVKTILSANTEATSTVESVAFDLDFKTKVTREQFERACSDLRSRFAKPIHDAVASAGLNLDQISSVILTGGNSRTPMVQAAIKAAVGEHRIAQNVNADEAAVLGAGLYGASLSRQFKTKDIRIADIATYDIQASYFASTPDSRTIHSSIFPKDSKYGSHKTLSFKRKEDFSVWFDYKTEVAPGFPREILQVQISGVAEALGNLTERGAIDPVVKLTVALSDSGFVSAKEAVAYGEVRDESLAGMLKGLFGGGSGEQEVLKEQDTEDTVQEGEGETRQTTPATKEKKTNKEKKDMSTIPLEVNVVFSTLPPMTVAEKRAARDRLRAIDSKEVLKRLREEAHNTLEAYLYKLRDILEDGPDSPFMKCSKASERQAISKKLADTIAWLHEEGEAADTTALREKRGTLELLERPIVHRYKEIEDFPQVLNNSQKWNWSTRLFLAEARANLTAEAAADVPSKWTSEELDGLEAKLKEHEAWLHGGVERHKRTPMNEDPAIQTKEMKERAKALEQHLQRLVKKKAPKVKKPASGSSQRSGSSDSEPKEPDSGRGTGHDEL